MLGVLFSTRISFAVSCLLLTLAAALPANAIITRHDVADEKFLALGREFRDSICNLNVTPKVPDCMATFLNKRWIITAGHCAEVVTARMNKSGRHEIEFRGELFEVEKVYLHPRYVNDRSIEDIALIKLRVPVPRVQAIEVLSGPLYMNEPLVVAGYGDIGTGKTGPAGNDAKLRAGTNVIDRVSDQWVRFRFDAPESPNATDLEAISGPGDSGGPALVRRSGKYFIVGISSRQSTAATNGREGLYGVTEFYAHAPTYNAWISTTLKE
jgi:secreted trypsin-like serine protease